MTATKIALVTGASRGLGYALAKALAPTHHVIAVARTVGGLEDLDDAVQQANGKATLAPMDVCDDGAMQHLCRGIFDRWGHIDLWAHTAIHAAPLSPAGHVDKSDFDKSLAVNLSAVQSLVGYVEPLLLAASASKALFFDDTSAGEKFFGAYGATKAAQIAYVRSWQAEQTARGVDVRILTPAPMPTALRARFYPGEQRDDLSPTSIEAEKILAALA